MSTRDNHMATRVFLRPIGVPLPLGFAGLAIASFVDSGLELHWINGSQVRDIGLILIAVPFILQLIAGVLCFLARDGTSGAALGVLATTWLALGLIHVTAPGDRASGALGLLFVTAGACLALSALVIGLIKPLPGLIFFAAAIRFELSAVYQLSTTSAWEHAAGVLGLVIVAAASYSILAFELESQSLAPMLPTFRRGQAAAAADGGAQDQVEGIAHEAGVRQTT